MSEEQPWSSILGKDLKAKYPAPVYNVLKSNLEPVNVVNYSASYSAAYKAPTTYKGTTLTTNYRKQTCIDLRTYSQYHYADY